MIDKNYDLNKIFMFFYDQLPAMIDTLTAKAVTSGIVEIQIKSTALTSRRLFIKKS
jgi:hypothetical protein